MLLLILVLSTVNCQLSIQFLVPSIELSTNGGSLLTTPFVTYFHVPTHRGFALTAFLFSSITA